MDISGLGRLPSGATVALALSGGVDSAVAAWTLKKQGCLVRPYHLILNEDRDGLESARSLAELLSLDLTILDVRAEFQKLVVEPFIKAYENGLTPNPCVVCNPNVKFGLLPEIASRSGIEFIATGHYAGVYFHDKEKTPALIRPKDRTKDQTYFLCRLDPSILNKVVFPLANMTKNEAREIGERIGVKKRPESQEICFLAGGDYRELIQSRPGTAGLIPGDFIDGQGKVLGRHKGVANYTIGQRRGLGVPGPEPYYVLSLDPIKNQVLLGHKKHTYSSEFMVRDMVWHLTPNKKTITALVQIRSRHKPAPADIRMFEDGRVKVLFHTPQSSITAGQAAAFYSEDKVLGGGWIEKATFGTPLPESA